MKTSLIFLAWLAMGSAIGQDVRNDSIYLQPQLAAEFIYGPEELSSFISNNIIVPRSARYYGINGEVEAQYVIDTLGNIGEIFIRNEFLDLGVALEVQEKAGEEDFKGYFSNETRRVIRLLSGLYYPAKDQGQKVNSAQVITLKFKTKQYEDNQRLVRQYKANQSGPYINWNFGTYTKEEPDYASDRFTHGVEKLQERKNDLACKYFEEAIRLNRDFVDAYFDLGIAYARLSRMAEACEMWEEAHYLGDSEAGQLIDQYCK